jgi:glycosyltransferase involved in cell wall biosynthesis
MLTDELSLIVTGGLGNMPFAGVAWQVLHYLEGFRRLGHRVFYLEDTGAWPFDPERGVVSEDAGPTLAYVRRMLERVQLDDSWAYRDAVDGKLHGASEERLRAELERADALVNVSAVTVLGEEHMRVPVRIYLETDPVLAQIEIAQGNQRTVGLLAAHTHHFTYGENFGAPDCTVPLERFTYHPTRQPVILDWWRPKPGDGPPRPSFTTVASWKQTAKDIEWQGELLTWSKDVQFQHVLDLPRRVSRPLELALAIDDDAAVARLSAAGWTVVPAGPLSDDLDGYRDYVRASAGEFSVAKAQYARLRSGWFSDRTACYLAAGRPAVVQDTGFGSVLPVGEGLFAFDTIDEAAAAIEAIDSDYERHARAAAELAREHFDAEVVLGRMLADAGLSP